MRALVSGYYGYGNVGDEALLAGLLAGLHSRGIEPVVLSGDPRATHALHDVHAVDRYRGLPAAVARCDALVSGGGGLLQDVSSQRSLSYYLTVMRLARLLGKRVVVYGQSVGTLSQAGRRRVGRALRGVPIAVRDAPSAALLGELGIEAERVADAALLLSAPARPNGVLPVLLIPRAGHDDLNDALLEAGRLLRAADVPVAVLGLHEREDAEATSRVSETLDVPLLRAPTHREALAHVAATRYVLSARLHGLIFAAIAGVGFAGLVYDPKVAGFLADARAPLFERPVDARRLADAALAAQPPDADAVRQLRERAEAGLDWLALHILG
ncbi:MAG: polysaccharide pyruvyl transferase CsaB [Deinococcales bacterium]